MLNIFFCNKFTTYINYYELSSSSSSSLDSDTVGGCFSSNVSKKTTMAVILLDDSWHDPQVTWPLIPCYLLQSNVCISIVGFYWVGSHPKCRHMPTQHNPQSRPVEHQLRLVHWLWLACFLHLLYIIYIMCFTIKDPLIKTQHRTSEPCMISYSENIGGRKFPSKSQYTLQIMDTLGPANSTVIGITEFVLY